MAEKKLNEIEEKYWRLFDVTSAGVSLSSFPRGEVIKINDGYLNMIGYTREEVLGHTSDEVGWLKLAERQKMFDAFFAGNYMLKSYEIDFTRKSGEKGTAVFSAVLAEISGEKYFLATIQDITERRKAEEVIKDKEEKFRRVFNISPAGIAIVNSSSKQIAEVNDAYLGMVGYTRDEVVGRTSLEVGWLDKEAWQKLVDTVEKDKKVADYEIDYTQKSGERRTALFSAEPMEVDGRAHYLVTVQDITQRKMAERKTEESEEKFRKLFGMSHAGIALIKFPSTVVIEMNDAYLKMLGYTRQEVIGHTSVEVGWFEEKDQEKMAIAFYQNGKMLRNFQLEYKKKSGRKGTALFSYDQVVINNETFLLATAMDISQLLEGEKRKSELLEQLEQANKDLESFSYNVSHDLRAPLRTISGFLQILASKNRDKLDEKSKQLIDSVEQQAKSMGALIDALLTFSRETSKQISKSTIDMHALAKSALDESLTDLKGKEIILHDLIPACGDSAALKQVFVNLISNAQKYSSKKEHPIIEIDSYSEGDECVYSVRDNGAGFDMKFYDQLFHAFKRLHGKEQFEGSGIGLAIVSKIVTKHGGKVWAEGKVDEGATFYFSLPKEGL